MKVAELIDLLGAQDANADVFVVNDEDMCGYYEIEVLEAIEGRPKEEVTPDIADYSWVAPVDEVDALTDFRSDESYKDCEEVPAVIIAVTS